MKELVEGAQQAMIDPTLSQTVKRTVARTTLKQVSEFLDNLG